MTTVWCGGEPCNEIGRALGVTVAALQYQQYRACARDLEVERAPGTESVSTVASMPDDANSSSEMHQE